ncbi:hypothetical protein E1B28_004696 [Marasmius oreades]|uniref:Btz domain-containing protein n=1 Tax=Marasmius oreades TaxID=181124 RepID=A0A9P7UZ48_9AGAR|nr:uncharacterized protein E1B28_004696 [Marasmius oreades]KAG7097339.1 hypothetical protein E1B28_004696 [Marasmius oreades]
MPAPITSSSPPQTVDKPVTSKRMARIAQLGKRTRMIRRRGRAKGAIGSDDEIEREARTDSESEDDISSWASSDTESEPDDNITNGSHHPLTPSTSDSPPEATASTSKAAIAESFFASSGNWSEMVADETANGPPDLPVIEFSQLDNHVIPVPSRTSKKTTKRKDLSRNEEEKDEASVTPVHSRATPVRAFHRRPTGQSARQAYQQRLETDPSYVPTVGEFWGHDDRLLDKDLRSLSGWWRGRWQGRGRGGGFVRGKPRYADRSLPKAQVEEYEAGQESGEVPPVERAWTHDGFEEMKRNDERQHAQNQPQTQLQSPRGGAPRGRGGVTLRGRSRGGFHPFRTQSLSGGPRTWFAMKPERMWTKQSDMFLYLDPSSKPRPGHTGIVRVKLPGKNSRSTKHPIKEPTTMTSPKPAVTSTTSINGSDYGGTKVITVCLPKPLPRPPGKDTASITTKAPEPSIEEVFTVRPRLVSPKLIPLPEPPSDRKISTTSSPPANEPRALASVPPPQTLLDPVAQQKLEQLSIEPQEFDPHRRYQTEEAVLRSPPTSDANGETDARPSLPPIQTTFTPSIPHGSPAFGSPYGFPHPLPLGVAVDAAGMTYELATGRPVYLPAPTMYTPRPIPQPFIPGHVHHRSAASSSDFIAHPSPPQQQHSFIDHFTGQPFFSFPRQSSRVEIRAPDGSKASGKPWFRTGTSTFETSHTPEYFAPPEYNGNASNEEPAQPSNDPSMAYNPYQSYYPEGYGYTPYMDISQMGQYGIYPPDHISQGTVFY